MKTIQKILLLMIFISSLMLATTITSWKTVYPTGNAAWIKVENKPNNAKDWIGIYKAGSNNDWENAVAWKWAKDDSKKYPNWYEFPGLKNGKYEARFFLNNSYKVEKKVAFTVGNTAVKISTWKANYKSNEHVWIKVENKPNNAKDWIGIYKAGSNNEWGNVVAWKWSKEDSKKYPNWYEFSGLKAGKYEARFFLNNSYKVEKKVAFTVGNTAVKITTSKASYKSTEHVWIKLSNKPGNAKDWIGIYKAGSNNDWGNVVAWKWAKEDSKKYPNWYMFPAIKAGKYEARFFLNNSFKLEAKSGFSVTGNGGNEYVYGSEGPYLNKVKINNDSDKYVVYYPEGHVQNAPVILFFGMSYAMGNYDNNLKISLRHEGIMKYLASLGCYVIGNKKKTGGWTNATKWPNYTEALVSAKNKGVDTTKLGIVGHSAGGMAAYWWMKKYKEQGYGATKTFIIDLHGYYASKMTKNDLKTLTDVDSLFIAYGGFNGNANLSGVNKNKDFSEDPRTLLTLSHLLPNSVKKGFVVINSKDHFYSYGEWEETTINGNTYSAIKNKKDLLNPIDAMVKYEFFNKNGQYNNAKTILFDHYTETVQKVYDATIGFIGNDGNWKNNYKYTCVNYVTGDRHEPTIDYCNDHGLQ